MEWKLNGQKLEKEFKLKNFSEIVKKLNEVAVAADAMNHHPDVTIYGYNKVKFTLCTHSQNNTVTALDHELANKIDELFLEG